MYEKAIKNKDKPEFNFETNNATFDFSIIVDGEIVSGSCCPMKDGLHDECYYDADLYPYSRREFMCESLKKVRYFLNLKNKHEYEFDDEVYVGSISLFNEELGDYESFQWSLDLTFCP